MKFTAVSAVAAVLAVTAVSARPVESYDLDARDFIDADMDEYYSREFDEEFEARDVYDEFADMSARDLLDALDELYARGGVVSKVKTSAVVRNPAVRKAATDFGKLVVGEAADHASSPSNDKKKKRSYYDAEDVYVRGGVISKIAKSEHVKKVATNPTVRKAAVEVGKAAYTKAGEKVLDQGRDKKKRSYYDDEDVYVRGGVISKIANSEHVKKVATNPTVRKAAVEAGKAAYSKAGEKVLEKGRDNKKKRSFWGESDLYVRGGIASKETVKKVATNPTVRKVATEVGKAIYTKAGEKVIEKGKKDEKKKRAFDDDADYMW